MTRKIINIKRFAIHDGPGIRTTVFLKGCPLRCIWCHNPEAISSRPEIGYIQEKCMVCGNCVPTCPIGLHKIVNGSHLVNHEGCIGCGKCVQVCPSGALMFYGSEKTPDELISVIMEDVNFYRESGGGVTVSGGEPLLQADFCAELLGLAKENGIHTAVDTCGEVAWEAFEKVLGVTDLFLYDIKQMDTVLHRQYTGVGNGRILQNLRRLSERGAAIEIRIPLVPGYNDDDRNVHFTGEFLSGLAGVRGVRVLPYHSLARSKYLSLGMVDTMPDVPSPSAGELRAVTERLRVFGLNAQSG